MKYHARGTFEVELKPQNEPDVVDGVTLARMSLDKQFHGDLDAVGKGEMLSARTSVAGSAGYVAIERVIGALHGRKGSFVFQHSGIMDHGAQQLSIAVVPDSGTEQLAGLSGLFTLSVVDGKHVYAFDYDLLEWDGK